MTRMNNTQKAMKYNFIDVVVTLYRRGCSVPMIAEKLNCPIKEVAAVCRELEKAGSKCDISQLYDCLYRDTKIVVVKSNQK